jgi:guanylate kinase
MALIGAAAHTRYICAVIEMPKFRIQYDYCLPGCGCGCDGNDLNIADQASHETFYFCGTREEAEQELERRKNSAKSSFEYWSLSKDGAKPRLVVLSGPSGVGKGPIVEWLKRLYYPEMLEGKDIPELYEMKGRKTRTVRHTGLENDLGFEGMSGNTYNYLCRGSPHSIDLDVFDRAVKEHDAVIFETYYTNLGFVKDRYRNLADIVSVFISPLSRSELDERCMGRTPPEKFMPDVMLDPLIRRALNDGKTLDRTLIKELLKRAEDSAGEMRFSYNYGFVLPNHCYECDSRWKGGENDIAGQPRDLIDSLHEIIMKGTSEYAKMVDPYRFKYYD